MNRLVKWLAWLSAVILLLLTGPVTNLVAGNMAGTEWWNASREPAGIAPDAADHPAAVVQVYAAKPSNAQRYTVYEVIGWQVRRGLPALVIHQAEPDRHWYGNPPEIIADIRGDGVDDVIRRIDAVARRYPYRDTYTVWPGPNSNTFTAWVARAVPELSLDLPPTAIGKDWLDARRGQLIAPAPSGTGYQFSLFGLFGVLAGVEEGLELNLAGLTVGVDPLDLALKLPGFGRIGGGAPAAQAQTNVSRP